MNEKNENDYPIIGTDKWVEILSIIEKNKRHKWIEVLLMFFYQPNHVSSLLVISRQYALSVKTVENILHNLSNFVCDFIRGTINIMPASKDFKLIFENDDDKGVLKLRKEIITALRIYLIDRLIKCYRGPVLSQGLDNENSKELYKWKILSEFKGLPTKDILELICSQRKEMNFLNWRIKDSIRKSLGEYSEEVVNCFEILRNASGAFYEKFTAFVANGKGFLSKEAASNILKENVASLFLTFVDPTRYVIYRKSLYALIAKYLGYTPEKSTPYEVYVKILKYISEREDKDGELEDRIRKETEKYFWSPLLNAQDIIWQTQGYIASSFPKNWLQKIYERGCEERHWVFENWVTDYKRNVATFLEMFGKDKSSQDVEDSTKDLFLRVKDNSISSNGQGMYSYEEYGRILEHWDEIYDILKRNVETNSISLEDYRTLNQLIEPLLNKRKPSAYHRLWAALFPEKLCTIIERGAFNYTYEKIRQIDDSLPYQKGTWVESNMALMDYLKDKVNFKDEYHRPLFAWYLKENLNSNDIDMSMNKYTDLLKENHNLVLTGAPGTGKTYLAKKIAEAMGDSDPGFVQFHPSMDYSDFVEGLRPNLEKSSFERKDGIFKKFCKDALSSSGCKVFIIDEINRGELSKIFGELFFSIEPSYRGPKNAVKTQYQNLVEEGDPFEAGFYVPENVYVIGTMNDIDRGVESMDFAIRRRFAWMEIKPEDRKEMLCEEIYDYSEEAIKVMDSINAAITGEDINLPSAYEIGPAYFLKLKAYHGDFQKLWDYNIKGLLYRVFSLMFRKTSLKTPDILIKTRA